MCFNFYSMITVNCYYLEYLIERRASETARQKYKILEMRALYNWILELLIILLFGSWVLITKLYPVKKQIKC